jgi:hypothetical protein
MSEYISECVLWMTPKPLGVERLCPRLNNILWKRGYGKLQTAFMLQTMPLSAVSRWHHSPGVPAALIRVVQ